MGSNTVYIAKSLDGYIAGPNGELDFLNIVPNPEGSDLGFVEFMSRVDALLMGRNTFEMVCSFDSDWPYDKPVFVWSTSLDRIEEQYADKAFLVKGNCEEVLSQTHAKGAQRLYIDGGRTIQSFLKEDLVDEMIIATIPILIGSGIPLFASLNKSFEFELIKSEVLLDQIIKSQYKIKSS